MKGISPSANVEQDVSWVFRQPTLSLMEAMEGMDGSGMGNDNGDGTTTFVVPLSGDQEVPPVNVEGATGEGNLTIDTASGNASGSVAVSGLSGPATMAHIHQGFAGSNGDVVLGLEGNEDSSVWSVPAATVLSAEILTALSNGELYINVHTEANPGGELRGQIIPEGVVVQTSALTGQSEVPPVTTEAMGTGVSTVNTETGAISASVVTTGVTATMAHIHMGIAGENGDVIIGLEQDPADANIWRTPAGAMLGTEQVVIYQDGGLYFNVHSEANPGGEIRGQL